MKPKNLPFCKVVAVITVHRLWSSQIIIFYSKDYYDDFWNREGASQKWIPLHNNVQSFAKSRKIDTDLNEKGYLEIYIDDDFVSKSNLWFYGEL